MATTHHDPITALAHHTGGAHDADFLARIAWACITDPADAVRGSLINLHGAPEALRLTLSDQPASDEPASEEVEALRGRVRTRFNADMITRTAEAGYQILTPGSEHWPVGLADLGDTEPVCLWVRGDAALLSTPSIAVVGARAATGYGENVTLTLVEGLVDAGWTIVSGAAYGIDGMAHRAALACGGNTVAVLAGCVDRFYPSGHDNLLARIADAGAVVSEIPPGSAPTKLRFLQRNRILAAMTQKTIVVEAGSRSGALDTAGHAQAIGRPVGAVPGSVMSVASAGCHRLIREHQATLITTADDAHIL